MPSRGGYRPGERCKKPHACPRACSACRMGPPAGSPLRCAVPQLHSVLLRRAHRTSARTSMRCVFDRQPNQNAPNVLHIDLASHLILTLLRIARARPADRRTPASSAPHHVFRVRCRAALFHPRTHAAHTPRLQRRPSRIDSKFSHVARNARADVLLDRRSPAVNPGQLCCRRGVLVQRNQAVQVRGARYVRV